MKFIAIAMLSLVLMGCNYAPDAKKAYYHNSDAFMYLCVPSTIVTAFQHSEDGIMFVATCTKAK